MPAQDQSLINKNLLQSRSLPEEEGILQPSETVDQPQDIDKVIRRVNKNLKKRSAFEGLMRVVIFLLFLGIFTLAVLLIVHRDAEVPFIEPAVRVEQNAKPYLIDSPSLFLTQSREVDLTEVDGSSIIAFNPVTYQIYVEKNVNESRKIASITKLMTAIVATETFNDETVFEYDEELADVVANGLGIEKGDKIRYEDAMTALLVGSKNDVAMLIAQNHPDGYSAFIDAMNEKAQELGMFNTSFSNATGYDDVNNYSTAWDLRKLAIYSINNEEILAYVQIPRDTVSVISSNGDVRDIKVETTNFLLGTSPSVKGLKTGYTEGAGQCFIGYFKGEGDDQLITIILGTSEDRFDETLDLFESINESYVE